MKTFETIKGKNMLTEVIRYGVELGLALAFPKEYNKKVIFGDEVREAALFVDAKERIGAVGFISKFRSKIGYAIYQGDSDGMWGIDGSVLEERQLESINESYRFSLDEWISMGKPLFLNFESAEKRYFFPLEEPR
jgi:hypothetical protein